MPKEVQEVAKACYQLPLGPPGVVCTNKSRYKQPFILESRMETCWEMMQAHTRIMGSLLSTSEKKIAMVEKAIFAVDAVKSTVMGQDQVIVGIGNRMIEEGSFVFPRLGEIGITVPQLQEDLTTQRNYCASVLRADSPCSR